MVTQQFSCVIPQYDNHLTMFSYYLRINSYRHRDLFRQSQKNSHTITHFIIFLQVILVSLQGQYRLLKHKILY